MLANLFSTTLIGIEASLVRVEVDICTGLPHYTVVGLPDAGANESQERVRAALRNSSCHIPSARIIVNLAPGDIRKEGPRFDLAIALGIAAAARDKQPKYQPLDVNAINRLLVLGELAMDGSVSGVRGVLPSVLAAKQAGLTRVMVPEQNAKAAALVSGIEVLPARSLRQAIDCLAGLVPPLPIPPTETAVEPEASGPDLSDVRGQHLAKRALEICAAGGHHLLMLGPPGSGKTLLASCLPSILPPLTEQQALEVTAIHSIMQRVSPHQLCAIPPFRSPSSNITSAGLTGSYTPGEISLAHQGVLFADEFPEFKRDCLEALRAPLECGSLQIARAKFHVTYPCQFTLVAAMNPCPCGYYGDERRDCACSYASRERYYHRISGPILDRIDLQVRVNRPDPDELLAKPSGITSAEVRQRVLQARAIQNQRGAVNSQLSPRQTRLYCSLDQASRQFLSQAMRFRALSARVGDRLCRVARTIADLANHEHIELTDLAEALEYRALEQAMNNAGPAAVSL